MLDDDYIIEGMKYIVTNIVRLSINRLGING